MERHQPVGDGMRTALRALGGRERDVSRGLRSIVRRMAQAAAVAREDGDVKDCRHFFHYAFLCRMTPGIFEVLT